jgi:hypothetical protein
MWSKKKIKSLFNNRLGLFHQTCKAGLELKMLKIDPRETFFFMYLEQYNWRNYNSQTIKSYSYVFSPSVISNILNIQLILGFLF